MNATRTVTRSGADRTAAGFAYAAAVAGVAGVATLGGMYAIEVPHSGPYVLGTANDAISGLLSLLVIPVIARVHRRVPPAAWTEPAMWIVVASCVAGAASSFLLVFRVLDFVPSTVVSVAAIIVQAGWLLLAHVSLASVTGYPRSLGRLGRFAGAGVLIGLPVAGLGYVLHGPDWIRWTVSGAGLLVGVAGWLAWPIWYFLAGRYLSRS